MTLPAQRHDAENRSMLVDLPSNVLLELLSSPAGMKLAATCKKFASLYAAARPVTLAGIACRSRAHKPGKEAPQSTQELLSSTTCTPAAISYVRQLLDDNVALLLLKPSVAEWVAAHSASQGCWTTSQWLFRLADSSCALPLLHRHRPLYQRAWVSAAGGAAGGQHNKLLNALQAWPGAPGQPHGRPMLTRQQKADLLCVVMRHTQDPAASLQAAMPIIDLRPPIIKSYFAENENEREFTATLEAEHNAALLAAGLEACSRGLTTAIPALVAHGLVVDESVARQLLYATIKMDQGDVLTALLCMPVSNTSNRVAVTTSVTDQQHPLHTTWKAATRDAWLTSRTAGKQRCVLAILDVSPRTLDFKQIAKMLKRYQVHLALACVKHAGRHLQICSGLHKVLCMPQCTLELLLAILAHEPSIDKACLEVTVKGNRVMLLQMLLNTLDDKARHHALSGDTGPVEALQQMIADVIVLAAGRYQEQGRQGPHCFPVLLDHIIAWSNSPQLQLVHNGMQSVRPQQATVQQRVRVWIQVLHALLIVGDHELAMLVLQLPCLSHSLPFPQELVAAAAQLCARGQRSSPALLMELVKRGAPVDEVVRAVEHTEAGVLLLAKLLPAISGLHAARASELETSFTELGLVDDPCTLMECMGLHDLKLCMKGSWADEVVSWLANTYTTSAKPHVTKAAFACLQTVLCDCLGSPHAALRVPTSTSHFRSKRDHQLLKWLLTTFGPGRVLSSETQVASPAGGTLSMAEALAQWAPLPFLVTMLAHGADRQDVLSGLCLRATSPSVELIHQVIHGEVPCLARNSLAAAPSPVPVPLPVPVPPLPARCAAATVGSCAGQPGAHLVPAKRVVQHAVMSGHYDIALVLIDYGANGWQALQACKSPSANQGTEGFMHQLCSTSDILQAEMQDVEAVLGAMPRQGEAVSLLVSLGVAPDDVLLVAAKLGACTAIRIAIDVYGADATHLLDQPVVCAAECGHMDAVGLLVTRGASADAALYGAACGQQVAVAACLLSAFGANPHSGEGSIMRAALDSGNEQLLNLILDWQPASG